MESAAVLIDCKQRLEKLDFTPCFMEHENFKKEHDGRVPLHVLGIGRSSEDLGTQCPAHMQINRPHCNHTSQARDVMIEVLQKLEFLGILPPKYFSEKISRIRKAGRQQERYDVEGRNHIFRLPINEFGTNPEMERVRYKQDANRARLENIAKQLLSIIDQALGQETQ